MILLVGQAPSRGSDPRRPLEGGPVRFLGRVSRVGEAGLLAATRRRNVLGRFPGKAGKGDAFPIREARARARSMAVPAGVSRVAMLGLGVARAFGVPRPSLLCEGRLLLDDGREVPFTVLPHPSGVNRWWNCPRNRARAGRAIRRMVLGRVDNTARVV